MLQCNRIGLANADESDRIGLEAEGPLPNDG
jgi:hypothetical protein